MTSLRLGFLGAGQMARALAGGFVRGGLVAGDAIIAHDPSSAACEQFSAGVPGARFVDSNAAVVGASELVIVAVKPSVVATVGRQVAGCWDAAPLIVSVAAGIPLQRLQGEFGTRRVIRVMPNTPCLVGRGACGYALGEGATAEDARQIGHLLAAVGIAFEVDESLLDAVTGLAGSGPAYVYTVIEALSDGGVRMGLPRPIATALAAQTVRGAAEMVQAEGQHPAVLRERVTSPAGTTITGMQALEQQGLRAALMAAVEAATRRSVELAGQEEKV